MPNQVSSFANQAVRLLQAGGDGIDFDFEHLNF